MLFNKKRKKLKGNSSNLFFCSTVLPNPDFVFEIDTTLGDGALTMELNPSTSGTISYTIDWGDTTIDTITTSGVKSHTYSNHGTYDIKLKITSGIIHPNLNSSTDRLKVIDLKNWGTYTWGNTMMNAFKQCSNLVVSATDTPDFSAVTSVHGLFEDCPSLTTVDLTNVDLSNCNNFYRMFGDYSTGIPDFTGASIGGVNMSEMFFRNSAFDGSTLTALDFSGVTNMSNMFLLGGLTNANYQVLLIHITGWTDGAPTKTVQTGVGAHFGNAKYEIGGDSEAAKNWLVSTNSWTITDGGGI